MFAAFSNVYATAFSGVYLALMLLLAALIFRAVAIEFRSKRPERWWRQMWEASFSVGSILSSLLIGTALGNIAWGVPVGANGGFAGTFLGLLSPYPLLVGITTVTLFMMHGAIYGVMKTEAELHDKLRVWAMRCIICFVICAVTLTMATLLFVPHMAARVRENPWLFSVTLANILAIANIPSEFHHGNDGRAFLSSCATIITLMALFALNIFPNMIYSLPNLENSLTIYNAASSPKTLGITRQAARGKRPDRRTNAERQILPSPFSRRTPSPGRSRAPSRVVKTFSASGGRDWRPAWHQA